MEEVRLDANLADYLILFIYFERAEGDRTVKGQPAPTGPDAAALAGSETTRRRPRRDRD
jgi:hypothetical protein